MKKNIIIALLIGLVLGGSALWLTRPMQVVNNQTTSDHVGSLSSPNIPWNYLSFGGVRMHYRYAEFAVGTSTMNGNGNATNTPCSFDLPQATTTLVRFTAKINNNVGSLQGISFDVSTSSTAFATSTTPLVLKNATVPAGGYGFFNWNGIASTSAAGTLDAGATTTINGGWNSLNIIGSGTTTPNYLVMKIGTSSTLVGYTGTCSAVLQEI